MWQCWKLSLEYCVPFVLLLLSEQGWLWFKQVSHSWSWAGWLEHSVDGTLRSVVTWASWHSPNISCLLCGEWYWDVPLVAVAAARRELSWQILLSLSCAWKEEGGREYMNENPGCRYWAELCCSSVFPLSPISFAWSSRVLLWVVQPCWGLSFWSASDHVELFLWSCNLSHFPQRDGQFSKVFYDFWEKALVCCCLLWG